MSVNDYSLDVSEPWEGDESRGYRKFTIIKSGDVVAEVKVPDVEP